MDHDRPHRIGALQKAWTNLTPEERLADIATRLDQHINATPSGDVRNFLTELNILVKAKQQGFSFTHALLEDASAKTG
jgi:replication-associated recombination protein RarA